MNPFDDEELAGCARAVGANLERYRTRYAQLVDAPVSLADVAEMFVLAARGVDQNHAARLRARDVVPLAAVRTLERRQDTTRR